MLSFLLWKPANPQFSNNELSEFLCVPSHYWFCPLPVGGQYISISHCTTVTVENPTGTRDCSCMKMIWCQTGRTGPWSALCYRSFIVLQVRGKYLCRTLKSSCCVRSRDHEHRSACVGSHTGERINSSDAAETQGCDVMWCVFTVSPYKSHNELLHFIVF